MRVVFLFILVFLASNFLNANEVSKLKKISFSSVIYNATNIKSFATDEEIRQSANKGASIGGLVTGSIFTVLGGLSLTAFIVETIVFVGIFKLDFLGAFVFYLLGPLALAVIFLSIGLPVLIYTVWKYHTNINAYLINDKTDGFTILKFNF